MSEKMSRRDFLKSAGLVAGASAVAGSVLAACQTAATPEAKAPAAAAPAGNAAPAGKDFSKYEFVWCNNMINLGMFQETDAVGLKQIAAETGVKTTLVGPEKNDLPAMVAAIDQTVARKPSGIMVVGWDASALVDPINNAMDNGVPAITIDADVPNSKRLTFVGTEWGAIGEGQARAMLKALNGRKGKVSMQGLIAGDNMQRAFAEFKKMMTANGYEVIGPFEDKGDMSEAARVATDVIRGNPDLVGMAGFDEGSVGLALAIKEEGKKDKIIGTDVNPSPQQLQFVKEGYLYALTGQKRQLFTYYGIKSLLDYYTNTVTVSKNDKAAGVIDLPAHYNTGTYIVDAKNIQYWLS
jgi:ABC-type sugar transport system substrate-binding protein